MTPEALKKMRERCETATEGPWHAIDVVVGDGGKRTGIYADERPTNSVAYCFRFDDETVPDGIFIAHARTDLPTCLDEIERLQKIEQCTNCTHTRPQTPATCPGHADAELPCAGFSARETEEAK